MHEPCFYPHPSDPYDPDDAYMHKHDDDEPFEQGFVPPHGQHNHIGPNAQSGAIRSCPKCQSDRVEMRHRARKTGGAVGAVCGAIAGAVIAGLIGGTAGCATGSMFGEVVDDKVLDNYRCHACGHTFSLHIASI